MSTRLVPLLLAPVALAVASAIAAPAALSANLRASQASVALDEAAISAIERFDGSLDGLDHAREAAIAIAALGTVAGRPVVVDASDVRFGIHDSARGVVVAWEPGLDARLVDTVRVTSRLGAVEPPMVASSTVRRSADGFTLWQTAAAPRWVAALSGGGDPRGP